MVDEKVSVEDQGIWVDGLGARMREEMWAEYRYKIVQKMLWFKDGKDSDWAMGQLLEEKMIADKELENIRTAGW